jgi:hypothetical protein
VNAANAVSLSVATAELHVRLDRLKREVDRPVPPPRPPVFTVLEKYDALCRRVRAGRGQS